MNGGKLWRFYENCKAIGYTFALNPAGAVEVTEPASFQNPVMRQEIAKRGRWLLDLVQLDGLLGRGLLDGEVETVRELADRLHLTVDMERLDLATGERHMWTVGEVTTEPAKMG